jgi:very-short-patch-repair endonuclease
VVRENARHLRRESTVAERTLWYHLRGGRLDGFHFRRQHPVGPFVVDFYCAARRLVVEVDGDTHSGREAYDAARTAWLQTHLACVVVRFTNDDIRGNLEAVVEAIREYLRRPPP